MNDCVCSVYCALNNWNFLSVFSICSQNHHIMNIAEWFRVSGYMAKRWQVNDENNMQCNALLICISFWLALLSNLPHFSWNKMQFWQSRVYKIWCGNLVHVRNFFCFWESIEKLVYSQLITTHYFHLKRKIWKKSKSNWCKPEHITEMHTKIRRSLKNNQQNFVNIWCNLRCFYAAFFCLSSFIFQISNDRLIKHLTDGALFLLLFCSWCCFF